MIQTFAGEKREAWGTEVKASKIQEWNKIIICQQIRKEKGLFDLEGTACVMDLQYILC